MSAPDDVTVRRVGDRLIVTCPCGAVFDTWPALPALRAHAAVCPLEQPTEPEKSR